MSTVKWLKIKLDEAHSHYEESCHRQSMTAREMARQEHTSCHQTAKTVAIKADGKTLLVVLPASRKVSLEKLRKTLRAKSARLLSEAEIQCEFSDCQMGAIPPFRHWKGVDLLADLELAKATPEFIFPAGNRMEAIHMTYTEWRDLANPKEGQFSEPFGWENSKGKEPWRETEKAIQEFEQGQGD